MTFLFTFSTLIFAFSFTQYAIHNTQYALRIITYEIINLFLQNEPNFRKSQMNVTSLITKNKGNWTLGGAGKTNPKRTQNKPNQTQFQRQKMLLGD